MTIKFVALPTSDVQKLQNGEADANGSPSEVQVSDGEGNPCRHCLTEIPKGEKMLVLSYSPFPAPQPYAELGPIFLCAKKCQRHPESNFLPLMFQDWSQFLIRGYNLQHRIKYGTGQAIDMEDIDKVAEQIFEDQSVKYIHIRSLSYNCYQCRIERA